MKSCIAKFFFKNGDQNILMGDKDFELDLGKEKFIIQNEILDFLLQKFKFSTTSDWYIELNGQSFFGGKLSKSESFLFRFRKLIS